jgi:hypothetical protein
MSKLVAEYLQHPLSASANIALLDDGNVGGVLGATLGSKLDLAGGKILQIVRATDSTRRTTTSTSFVDASISVTITPQKSDSAILLIWSLSVTSPTGNSAIALQIADNSNNAILGSQNIDFGTNDAGLAFGSQVLIGWATPATTSPTTYKGRFRCNVTGTSAIENVTTTGQLYAIEVSA